MGTCSHFWQAIDTARSQCANCGEISSVPPPYSRRGGQPCPHCAAKDAEIARLRERVERAADALERWMCDSSYDSSKGVNVVTAAQRILRGEGE